jgi:hypothetical protein
MTLGPTPTAAAVRRAVSGLVELFQALTAPALKSIQGLWAELLLIRYATDAVTGAWRALAHEHADFVADRQRIEVKSSSTRERAHRFSLAQLTPPAPARLIVASAFVERIGGGMSMRQLVDEVRRKLTRCSELLTRFDATFYACLGANWNDAMEECFDLELARDSLQFFDAKLVPKISEPVPTGVSEIRFVSDLSTVSALTSGQLLAAGGLFAAAAPR